MRQFRLRRSSPDEEKRESLKDRMVGNWQIIFILSFIVAIAFILRAFFAFDYAVSGGFALSGGSDAAYHLRVIEHIMETGSHLTSDSALNYPFGQQNVNPFLMDWTVAIIANLFTFFGVSVTTAATGTLVMITAILGALTCIPVYLLGRDMFGRNAGIIASLLYAVCSIAVYRTVLSNGTESAFYGFFFVLMIYFLYKAVKACSNESVIRNKGQIRGYAGSVYRANARAFRYAAAAGIMFALVALSWNGFRPVVLMMAFIMIVQVIVDRVRGKDPTAVASVYIVTLALGILISMPFYLLQGLWSLVFSGPFMIAMLAIIITAVISETKGRPWLLVVPVTAAAVAVFFVIMYFAAYGLFSDIVNGNSIYLNPIYESLVGANSVTSLSAMASYYGWLTMWLPYMVVAYFIYRARERMGSATHMFILTWMIAMLAISWRSSSYIFLAAPAYAVGGGAALAWLIRKADIRSYFSSFRGTGFQFKAGIRKIFKPVPFLTIMLAVFLVGAPNAIYAIDAGISANEKAETDSGVPDYMGAFSYYVRNDNTWKLNEAWRSMSVVDKSGALVTWGDYSSDAVSSGGFDTVAGINGAGASATSNMLLASGDKGIILAMSVRLMDYHGMDKFVSSTSLTDDQFNKLRDIIENPSAYISEILSNPTKYGKFSSGLTEENAMYIYALYYLSEEVGLTQNDAIDLYDAVCDACGNSINYIAVSAGMFPISANDGSFFSTIAYLNNYHLDSNGSPSQFYTANSYGYLDYKDAMYETVLWKAYIGPSPADYGYTSAIDLFNALSLSDGSENTRAQPGFGMPNYSIAYWKVMYNPDSGATLSSDGWTEMDALGSGGAIAKQAAEGGLINYMSGLPVILEYTPASTAAVSGTVKSTSGDPVKGVRISVFDSDGIQRNTVFTNEQGEFEIYNPYSGKIRVFVGSTSASGGLEIPVSDLQSIQIPKVDFKGIIFYDDSSEAVTNRVDSVMTVEIEGKAHGMKDTFSTVSAAPGEFTFVGLVPDTYTVTVKNQEGEIVSTSTLQPTLGTGGAMNIKMLLSSATVSLVITDEFDAPLVTMGSVQRYIKLENQDTLYSRMVQLDGEGKAEVKVLPGTYIATVTNSLGVADPEYILFDVTFTVGADGSFTLTEKAQRFVEITVTNNAPNFSAVTVTNTVVSMVIPGSTTVKIKMPVVPSNNTVANTYYAYALDFNGKKVAYGSVTLAEGSSGSIDVSSLTVADAFEFSRTLTASDDSAVAGQVNFYLLDPSNNSIKMFTSAATASGGAIRTWLPAGEYLVYAYSTDSSKTEAFLGNITISGPSEGGELDLVKGKTLTTKALISDIGTTTIPFVPVSITTNGMTISTVTDAKGLFSHPVPDLGSLYSVKIPAAIGPFIPEEGGQMDAVSATTTLTATFYATSPAIFGNLKFIHSAGEVTDGTKVKLESTSSGGLSGTFETSSGILMKDPSNQLEVPAGEYKITIEHSEGYHFSETITLKYSGNLPSPQLKEIEVIEVAEVVLDGLSTTDIVTIKALDDGYVSSATIGTGNKTYFLETGKEFLIQVKNADGDEVWYHQTGTLASGPATTLPVTLKPAKEIKGYAGHSGTGTVSVTYGGTSVIADVSGGNYTILLPDNQAPYLFKASIGKIEGTSVTYEYTGTTTWLDVLPESEILNMVVVGKPKDSTPDIKVSNTTPSVNNEFNVTVEGNGFQALFLIGGAGWKSIEFFSDPAWLNKIDFINGDDTNPVTFYVKATMNEGIAYDSPELSIIFKDATGKTIVTHVVTDIPGTPGGVLTIGRGEADRSSTSEYNLSVLLKNDSRITRTFTVNADLTSQGWFAVITDSTGKVIGQSGSQFTVAGLSETNVYVRLVGIKTNSAQDLPESFKITVSASGDVDKGNEAETVSGGVVITMKPFLPSLDIGEHGASGPNIFNDAGSIPIHTWIIIAASILAFALILWLGMKRGVFTRKK